MRAESAEEWAAWARRFIPDGALPGITVEVEHRPDTSYVVIRASGGLALAQYFDNMVRRTAGLNEDA